MSNVFNISYKRLVVLLLPTFLRQSLVFILLASLTRPIVKLYDTFKVARQQNIDRINQTGQVCYLRGMLNNTFDPTLRRIRIDDGNVADWQILYKEETFNDVDHGQPLYVKSASNIVTDVLGNKLLLLGNDGVVMVVKRGDVGAIGFDFFVKIPTALRGIADENQIKALVNYYKLASKRYEIQYF